MLKIICALLLFAGACTMSASILIYRKTIKSYSSYLAAGKKGFFFNRYNFIMVLMIFFLMGYVATLFYILELNMVDMSLFLIANIFFFGAIFCYSVVFVQSDLLNRLEQSTHELREAFDESKATNISLEKLNHELVTTMDTLKNTQSQLIFSEKMSTLGELVAGVSHEINTPICAVNASANSLQSMLCDQFPKLFSEIRELSEDDFQSYVHYTQLAIHNSRRYTSTLETRALKRKARQELRDIDGFNDKILELLSMNFLLDADTVTTIIPHLSSETFEQVLHLINETILIVTSVDIITTSSDKVIKMVASLKSFSHFNVDSEKSSFNIIASIETVLALYSSQLKYTIEVVTDFEPLINMTGYQDELNQVWSNLIQNAVHAMNDANSSSSEARQPNKLIITAKITDNDHITVSISDNGSGISSDKISKIFEPFYTTKPTGIGTGLGLSISKQIIDKHNGTINVESSADCGTTFTITLPIN